MKFWVTGNDIKINKTIIGSLLILVLIAGGLVAAYRSSIFSSLANKNERVTLVTLAQVKQGDMPVYISALGTVTPTNNIIVRTQVNGLLQRILFEEGQKVKKGQLLAEIDSRPYQAQLTQFEGQLARDQALLANAKIDLQRYKKLFPDGSISKQTLDTQQWLVKQNEGTVKADLGLVNNARVNLSYCKIISPIDGRLGLRQVDPGNLIQTSDANGIVTINTINPIEVLFSIPEDKVPQVQKQIRIHKNLKVEAYDRSQEQLISIGTLLTMDNRIDPSTGMIKLKAIFNNVQDTLFPSQFVNVRLWVDVLHQVMIVPSVAIQHDNKQTFVFVADPINKTVKIIPVIILNNLADQVAVKADLKPGQDVVVEGTDKLVDGAKIKTLADVKNDTTIKTKDKIKQSRA